MNLTRDIKDNEVIEARNGFYDSEGIFTKRSGDIAGNIILPPNFPEEISVIRLLFVNRIVSTKRVLYL